MGNDLTSEIAALIKSHREDDWWDFKREHQRDKADLVHDIICMANSRADRDAYIIYGIEYKSFDMIGVENDQERRNQQGITDILSGVLMNSESIFPRRIAVWSRGIWIFGIHITCWIR